MSPRPDVSEERKGQIMNAAEEVFSQKGFSDARMDDIAEETGLSKGTLYLYYKSKDKLIIAFLDRIFQREFQVLEDMDLSTTNAEEAIDIVIESVVKDLMIMFRLIPVVYEFLALAFRNKYVREALKHYLNRYMNMLKPIIQMGIDSGEFRNVDALDTAIAIVAVMEGTILLWVYDRSLVDPEHHIRSGMKLLLDGVKA